MDLNPLSKTLNQHAFTSGLNDSQIAKLAELAHQVSFQEDEIVLVAGQQSKHFYLLIEGSMCIEVGDAFGWSCVWTANALAPLFARIPGWPWNCSDGF